MEKRDHETIAFRPKKKFTTQIDIEVYEFHVFFKSWELNLKTKFLKILK